MTFLSYDTEWFHQSRNRSYESLVLKQECDKLARIAAKAITALEQYDPDLKSFDDQESRKWWASHRKAAKLRTEQEATEKAKQAQESQMRKDALSKLTPEEIEAFGLTSKKKKK